MVFVLFCFYFSEAIIATFPHSQQQHTPQIPQHFTSPLTEKHHCCRRSEKKKKESFLQENIYMRRKLGCLLVGHGEEERVTITIIIIK